MCSPPLSYPNYRPLTVVGVVILHLCNVLVLSQSRLGQEGDSLLRSLKTVTTRTTNGLARAVNVTGTAASVVAGGAFKLAGAAVLDAVGEALWAKGKGGGRDPRLLPAYVVVNLEVFLTGVVLLPCVWSVTCNVFSAGISFAPP